MFGQRHCKTALQDISKLEENTDLMSKPQDGFVSRFLNRPISRRITSVLLKFPIHPSTWTISICVLPLIASVFLVRGDYVSIVIGAAIFQVFSILDGCDGEIARAKNLESKLGERLDYFCDFVASLLYVLTLGLGLHRSSEGIVCAVLITANELFLRVGKSKMAVASSALHESFYARHRAMIGHSGLLNLGERFVWWLFQLTKRDMAILVFLLLALLGLADWILHLWAIVAGVSLILSAIAVIRAGNGRWRNCNARADDRNRPQAPSSAVMSHLRSARFASVWPSVSLHVAAFAGCPRPATSFRQYLWHGLYCHGPSTELHQRGCNHSGRCRTSLVRDSRRFRVGKQTARYQWHRNRAVFSRYR